MEEQLAGREWEEGRDEEGNAAVSLTQAGRQERAGGRRSLGRRVRIGEDRAVS